MKADGRHGVGWLRATFLAVLILLLLKLGLTFGSTFFKDYAQLSPTEVIAGDRKDKSQEASLKPQKGAPAPEKDALPAKDARTQPVVGKQAKAPGATAVNETIASLQQRESELRKKEEQLREKEERLAKMEKEVEQKLKDLISIQREIQTYRNEKAEGANTKVRSLAKIYGTMKPKEAAKLMENLDDKLVMNIISTMNSDEAASIMANMEVKKAAKISEGLSGK